MDCNHPFLKTQLIAYIGNKRALLPFLGEVFSALTEDSSVIRFLDLFAGSGAVARLAKYLGFGVHANDWETYSYILNSCHIATDLDEREAMFAEFGGLSGVLDWLMNKPAVRSGYIGTHYSPRSTESADYTRERLFYTRENGMFIDTVREGIEELYPGPGLPPGKAKGKSIILASLLYQAATHANTSGVFKAFHKGFGGHGKDALSRITRPMRLLMPEMMNGRGTCTVTKEDAIQAAKMGSADICYLDPPYNQHQYGSNYHLLNTIAKWDKPHHPLTYNENGGLKDKGGIRRDWTETKSNFCYRDSALYAFANLIDTIDAKYIALSYNTEGIIDYEDILDILNRRGGVDLYSSEYIKYRGGRQSDSRKVHNVEFLILCTTSKTGNLGNRESILRFFLQNKIRTIMRSAFYPEKIKQEFHCFGDSVLINGRKSMRSGRRSSGFSLPMQGFVFFTSLPTEQVMEHVGFKELQDLHEKLLQCCIEKKQQECWVILEVLKKSRNTTGGERFNDKVERDFERKLLRALKKIAHKKYKPDFQIIVQQVKEFKLKYVQDDLHALEELAEKRFKG